MWHALRLIWNISSYAYCTRAEDENFRIIPPRLLIVLKFSLFYFRVIHNCLYELGIRKMKSRIQRILEEGDVPLPPCPGSMFEMHMSDTRI